MHYLFRFDGGASKQRKTFATAFVNNHNYSKFFAVTGVCMDKIVGPNMVFPGRTQANARTIVQPQPFPFRLMGCNF
jgi:hypothetical protein